MKVLEIEGNRELFGTIRIGGAKNAAVALIPAAILADDDVTLCNVPDVTDVDVLTEMLEYLGIEVRRASESMVICPKSMKNKEIPENLSNKLRASYYFMGALLGKYKKVDMYFPGGCSIGARPINLHLKGFEAMGAKVEVHDNKYTIVADKLVGTNIYLDIASVGATINIMLAAVKAEGITTISNAAKEPEIVNVATFFNNMGAKITGAGTSEIKIVGVNKLNGCFHEVIPDRIEAGTYTIIGALLGKDFKVSNIIPEHLEALSSKLIEMGVNLEIGPDYFHIIRPKKFKSSNIKTLVYPGFPTDLQQPFSILLTQAIGKSCIEETIFENRFMHVPFLVKMGANIEVKDTRAYFMGPCNLVGCEVEATDLRAGAALVIAGLVAHGVTKIKNIEHILRGYAEIVEKLTNVGARISLKEI